MSLLHFVRNSGDVILVNRGRGWKTNQVGPGTSWKRLRRFAIRLQLRDSLSDYMDNEGVIGSLGFTMNGNTEYLKAIMGFRADMQCWRQSSFEQGILRTLSFPILLWGRYQTCKELEMGLDVAMLVSRGSYMFIGELWKVVTRENIDDLNSTWLWDFRHLFPQLQDPHMLLSLCLNHTVLAKIRSFYKFFKWNKWCFSFRFLVLATNLFLWFLV
ncbi:hypothetical protein Bca4012_026436 [Brassica carinata]